jgi:predicted nucleotidyltransferase
MRLKSEIKDFIKEQAELIFPDSELFLYGSRIDDQKKGGDIDILVLSNDLIEKNKIRQFRVEFYKKFGWQKIDVLNLTYEDNSTFKQIISKQIQAL